MSQVARKSLTTYLKPRVAAMAEEVATIEMRSMADYLRILVLRDIKEKLGQEEFDLAVKITGIGPAR